MSLKEIYIFGLLNKFFILILERLIFVEKLHILPAIDVRFVFANPKTNIL
jgi:hypothetical protein